MITLSRRSCLTFVAASSALVVAGCSQDSAGSTSASAGAGVLRLGPLNGQNPLTLAQTSGKLEAAVTAADGALEVSPPFAAFAPAAEAMTAGQIDMTSGSSTSLVTALVGNPDIVVFAIEENDNDTQGIVAAPGTGISSIEDLAGKRVAVNQGGTGDYILRMALTSVDMTVDDVELVYLGPADAATAFSAGQVDAWATWDQYLVTAEALDGAQLVTLAKDIGAMNRTIHVVSRSFAESNPALVKAAYDALVEQTEEEAADPTVLSDAFEASGAAPEIAEAIAAKRTPTIQPADAAFTTELQEVAQFYADQGLTDSLVDVSDVTVSVEGGA